MLSGETRSVPPRTIVHMVRGQARAVGAAPAVVSGEAIWSFTDLWQRTCDIAIALTDRGVRAGDAVVHPTPPTGDTIATELAIMAVGSVAVPLDVAAPPERVAEMVAALSCRPSPVATWYCGDGAPVADLRGVSLADLQPANVRDIEVLAEPDGIAYIMFTSGSTGTPKGVVVEHGNLANYVAWARHELLGRGVGSAVVTSLAYDLAFTGVWPVLAHGQPVHLYSGVWQFDKIFARRPVPFALIKLTPSHLQLFGGRGCPYADATAGLVIGGERLDTNLLKRIEHRLRGVRAHNHYGPTECTIGCCALRLKPFEWAGAATVPIGRPIWNTRAYVVDDRDREVVPGCEGELVIAGACVARGHLGAGPSDRFIDESAVSARRGRAYRTGDIVRLTENGELMFVGRRDEQVKLNGLRLDLAEVTRAAHTIAGVEAAQCHVRGGPLADLEVYVVAHRDATDVRRELRRAFADWLPPQARPRSIVVCDELLTTPNGKFDAAATAARAAVVSRARPGALRGDASGDLESATSTNAGKTIRRKT